MVSLTILAICTWANTIGSLIPIVDYKLKIDPAVVSAPLITTLVDAIGLAIYLLIAKAILGLSQALAEASEVRFADGQSNPVAVHFPVMVAT